MSLNPLLKVDDFAAITGTNRNAAYAAAKSGQCPAVVWVGRHLRFHPERLAQWLEGGGARYTAKPKIEAA